MKLARTRRSSARWTRGPNGPVSVGIGAGVDTDHPRSGRRGQMERAGVVGDHQVGFGSERRELEKLGPAAKVEHGHGCHQS